MIRPNPHIEMIQRDSDILSGRIGLVCLDRNERIGAFPDDVFKSMLDGLNSALFTAYPDLGPLYQRLERATGMRQNRIAVGAGSDGIIRRAFQAFLQPENTVIAPEPSYGMYSVWSRVFQANFKTASYGEGPNFRFDISILITHIKAGARICCIANPDQPTGSVLTLTELREIAKVCERSGTLLLIDEAYYPFHPDTALPLIDEFENVLIVRTFSKIGGLAGLRIGYALGAPNVIEALNVVRSPGEVNGVGAAVATYLLDNQEVLENFRVEVEQGRKILLAAAQSLGFVAPKCAGNFQLLKTPQNIQPEALFEELKARGFLIKVNFQHSTLNEYIRVTLDKPAIIETFVDAFCEVLGVLSDDTNFRN